MYCRSTVKPIDFESVGYIVANRDTGAVKVIADEKDQTDRFAVEIPLAIHQLSAHGSHFGVNNFLRLVNIEGVFRFERTGYVCQVRIIWELRGDREEFEQRAARINFLVKIFAVD